jgi:hypothetical protein
MPGQREMRPTMEAQPESLTKATTRSIAADRGFRWHAARSRCGIR